MPDDAAAPIAILQAIKDPHATGAAPISAIEAVALNGEDGIAISGSNDEEDSNADGLLQTNRYNLFGVDSSPQKRKAMASSGAASSSTPYRAAPRLAPKGRGNVFGTVQYGTRQLSQTHRALRSREAFARSQSQRSFSRIPPDNSDVDYNLALDGRGQRLKRSLEAAHICL